MTALLRHIRHSLVFKLILMMGCVCIIAVAVWAFFSVRYQRQRFMEDSTDIADRISKTIRLGTHYAMMLNSRDDINQIIQNTANQKEIQAVRIFNKNGEIKFSNQTYEVDTVQGLGAPVCHVCHDTEPPRVRLTLTQRRRLFTGADGQRLLGIISPIYNETGCARECHFHSENDQVLGALDVVISLEDTDQEIIRYEKSIFSLAMIIILFPSLGIFLFVYRCVIHPVRQLTEQTRHITGEGDFSGIKCNPNSEIGRLAGAFETMRRRINDNQNELTRQRNEYQSLFENVPCLITVQDRDFKLINFNREFYSKYHPRRGDYCYQAYKGRNSKCDNCPVEKTFIDGQSHSSEELAAGRDGTMEHWIVRTSPVHDADGNVVAAMEINLDITQRKLLEQQVEASEKRYHAIFNNIPNPVFVLAYDTLEILHCNNSVAQVYGYQDRQLTGRSFIRLFPESGDEAQLADEVRQGRTMNKVIHRTASDDRIFVDIWSALVDFPDQKILLVTTSDITQRLETEAQFNQAAKLATLGEMATGVAHELNQPLSVIKTSAGFCRSKMQKQDMPPMDILQRLLEKIESNVDRASKIITHMRDFSRKSDVNLEPVDVNSVLKSAYDIFCQQLKVRGIEVIWDLGEHLPSVMADPGRLEQVFINLLINARDAIEDKYGDTLQQDSAPREIRIRSAAVGRNVAVRIRDTGCGIPDKVRDKIFQPFFTTKEVGKGTGLGLSISYGIIKECRASIDIVETSSEGTCFQITLPSAASSPAS